MGDVIFVVVEFFPLLSVVPKQVVLEVSVDGELADGEDGNNAHGGDDRSGGDGWRHLYQPNNGPDATDGAAIEIIVPIGVGDGDGENKQGGDEWEQPVFLCLERE